MSAVYSCPHPGCDFVIGAVGPQDPDEPDYFTEDVEAHKRSHADDDGTESEAIAEVQVPHPGEIDEGPLVRSSSQAGLATLVAPTKPGRVFGYNLVTVFPDGVRNGGPRLTNAVTREEALAELDELAPFMVDGYTTVLVELREVAR